MKKIMLFVMAICLAFACQTPQKEKTGAENLLERMQVLQQKGYMFGH